jgi:hypothetical protein
MLPGTQAAAGLLRQLGSGAGVAVGPTLLSELHLHLHLWGLRAAHVLPAAVGAVGWRVACACGACAVGLLAAQARRGTGVGAGGAGAAPGDMHMGALEKKKAA